MSNEIGRNLGKIVVSDITANSAIIYSPARTVSKVHMIQPVNNTITVATHTITGWHYDGNSGGSSGVRGFTAGALFYQRIPEPIQGATLVSIDLYYYIFGTARSPATRLNMTIRRQNKTAFTGATIMAATQVPAYSSFSTLLTTNFATTANQVIDNSLYDYMIVMTEESGAGASAGNRVYCFRCNYTVTTAPIE